jgi:hypothetical protein
MALRHGLLTTTQNLIKKRIIVENRPGGKVSLIVAPRAGAWIETGSIRHWTDPLLP